MTHGQYGSAADNSVIEPYEERRARRAAGRKVSIAREAAKLRATYLALGLPVPMLIEGEPEVVAAPKVNRGGRPPSAARAAAMAAGRKTYLGARCRRGHSGLRYVRQSVCVACARLHQKGRKAVNHPARSRAQRPQMARGRVRPGRGHCRTRKTERAPRVISTGRAAALRSCYNHTFLFSRKRTQNQ